MDSIIILGIGLSVAILVMFILVFREKLKDEEDPLDDVIFKNYLPQYAKGHSQGVIIEVIRGDKRTGIRFMPRDIDYLALRRTKEKKIVEPQLVWFQDEKLIAMPKGTLSSHRHELLGLPQNAEDLPSNIKKTVMGMALMQIIEAASANKEEVDVLRKRVVVQTKLVHKTEGYELVDDFMNKNAEINKDIIKHMSDIKQKSSSIGDNLKT